MEGKNDLSAIHAMLLEKNVDHALQEIRNERNNRWQYITFILYVVGGICVFIFQPGLGRYVLFPFPYVLTLVAQLVAHSSEVVSGDKNYLRAIYKKYKFKDSQQTFMDNHKEYISGSWLSAIRSTILLIQLGSMIFIVFLFRDMLWLAISVGLAEVGSMIGTWHYLHKRKRKVTSI